MINNKPFVKDDIVWRKEGSKNEIMSLTSNLGGPIYLLNPVAARIIELLNGRNSIEDINNDISIKFPGENIKTISRDVQNFLSYMKKLSLIDY